MIKKPYVILFILSATSLAIGACFHGFRMHPENTSTYQIGVVMGIVMISLFILFLIAGIITLIISRKNKK